jgi:hypothetical protein
VVERSVPTILDSLASLLAAGGAMILAVPFTNGAFDEHWVVQADPSGGCRSSWTTPDSYDFLASAPPEGVLPVRHFSLPGIKSELVRAGLLFEAAEPYNWFSARRADIFVLARKPHQ